MGGLLTRGCFPSIRGERRVHVGLRQREEVGVPRAAMAASASRKGSLPATSTATYSSMAALEEAEERGVDSSLHSCLFLYTIKRPSRH